MKKDILIVDDDPSMRLLLEHFLKDQFNIHSEEDGEQALCWLQDNNRPNLIVADIMMPSLHGFDFIESIRASVYLKSIPIIMLSSLDKSEDKIKCFKLGADDYLIKPFNPEELKWRIEKLLTQKSVA